MFLVLSPVYANYSIKIQPNQLSIRCFVLNASLFGEKRSGGKTGKAAQDFSAQPFDDLLIGI